MRSSKHFVGNRAGLARTTVGVLLALLGLAQVAAAQNRNGTPASALLLSASDSSRALLQPSRAPADMAAQEAGREWYSSPTFKSTIAAASLITWGLFTFKDEGFINRQEVRDWRNTYIPDFHDTFNDYTQFLSGFLALGLNVAGVQGTSKLPRAAASYAGGLGIMMVAVHSVKGLTEVRRPDGSATNSFPSGHTAAAFASARFLDREYGHVSYLYSLAGYGSAVYAGVMRQLNNRHWESDVFVGAGIGLLSTDISYALMDGIFGDKGKNPPRGPRPPQPPGNPSFLDFRVGYAQHVGDLADRDEVFSAKDGWTSGFEGAFFFNDYIGVGGELSVAAFAINDDNFVPEDSTILQVGEEINTQPFGTQSVFAGPFFNLPLGERLGLTGKAAAGWVSGATATLSVQIREEFQDELGMEVPVLEFEPKDTFGFAVGVAFRALVSSRIGVRLFGEYNYSKPDFEIRRVVDVDQSGGVTTEAVETVEGVDFSYFGVGASVSALIW